jgi:hypothetical protein
MMAYFGELIKMCANLCYLMMTLNRYLLIGKDQAPWLISFAKLEFKWVIRSFVLVSALLNIGHIWEYGPMEDWVFSPLIGDLNDDYKSQGDESMTDYPIANYGQAFFYYTIVYFVINCVVFFVVNTWIEVQIVRKMHKEIKGKRERIANMSNKASSSTTPNGTVKNQQDLKKAEEDEKKERRVINMVILNSILNLFLRSPDVLVLLENQNIWKTFVESLTYTLPGFFNFVVSIGYFTYILTFSTNFAIFYFFNLKFKEAVIFIAGTVPKK